MAKKPHKYVNNGVALDTVLSIADLKSICAQAAVESTGDLWNGTNKIVESESGDTWILYVVQGSLRSWAKFMTFTVTMSTEGGRSTLKTDIVTYSTTQTTVMFIPVSPKKMVVRHVYLQFINKVANTVRQADASARVAINEGEWMPDPSLPASTSPLPSAVAVASPAITEPQREQVELAVTPPPPPPPPPVTAAPSIPDPSPADESTQKIQRRARAPRWLVTPHGMTPIPLASPIVIGRSPSDSGDGNVYLLTVPRSENTVSKSHARLELLDGGVVITDLGSINGTILVGADDKLIDCEPHVATAIPAGYEIELGDFLVSVELEGSVQL
ncbi:MAG: hypothetical protein JWP19_673 [Rhodoglobus sp.]|nr:hypothetical protein [Rhodoglobus sp.]